MAAVVSPEGRAVVIEELLQALRERDRLFENRALAPARGVDFHQFPDLLARCERQIRLLEGMLT